MNGPRLGAFYILLHAIVLSAASVPARVQSGEAKFFQPGAMRITIPFAFTAGEATLPAGTYTIKRLSQTSDALLIASVDGKASAAVQAAGTLERKRTSLPAKLVFHQYENAYYLAQVWAESSTVGREVSMSKAERALANRDAKPKQVAVLAHRP
jgi:hypothetical protein